MHNSDVVSYILAEKSCVKHYLLHRVHSLGFLFCENLVVREAAIMGEPFEEKYNEDWLIPVSRTDSEWV